MNASSSIAVCAICGQQLDRYRAPRVRFSGREKRYFCSIAHADAFQWPRSVLGQGESAPGLPSRGSASTPPEEARGSIEHSQVPEQEEERRGLEEVPSVPPGEPGPKNFLTAVDSPTASPLSSDSETGLSQSGSLGDFLDWLPILLTLAGTGAALLEGAPFWPGLASALVLSVFVLAGQQAVRVQLRQEAGYLAQLKSALAGPAVRIFGSGTEARTEIADSESLRPGQELLVRAGEYVPADGTVLAGEGTIRPFLAAEQVVAARQGLQVAAGAFVEGGELQMICSKTGADCAFAPLLGEDAQGIAGRVWGARFARRIAFPGAPALATACAALVWAQGHAYSTVLVLFGSVAGAFSLPLARRLPRLFARAWLCRAARRGVSFPHEVLIDRSGTVSSAVFCARGTVLHGEPEVAEIHAFRGGSDDEVLALAAGAESVVHHPIAAAMIRAANSRGVCPDASRSHNIFPGLGVVCVSALGESLVVGSRELLLRERISIALAEEALRSLEARGLTALLVARDSHLIGVLALQDSLRAGAKAAVQILLDEGIEPVLLSGDSRATTEAVAHALACEHVRPEVPAPLRAAEVRNLIEAGAVVAVIGGSPRDDGALGAAEVPIVLEGAATTRGDSPHPHERGIGLVGNQVMPAVLALLCGRRIRTAGFWALSLSYVPPLLGAMISASLLGPAYSAPLLAGVAAHLASAAISRWSRRQSL